MNKQMFWTGLSIFILEALGIFIYFLTKVDTDLLSQIIVISAVAILNIFAFILVIVGLIGKENDI